MEPRQKRGIFAFYRMEQHPVPQNVTTFQFRLIGDMTLKQFGYLIGGAIGAYIMYKLPLPFFFTWPLAVLSAVGGFGLAFVPIEERPMDIWVLSFIKSVYSPTQYVWFRQTPHPPEQQATPLVAQSSAAVKQIPAVAPSGSTSRTDVLQNIFLPGVHTPTQPSDATLIKKPKTSIVDWLADLWGTKAKSMPPTPPSVMRTTLPTKHMDFSPPPIVRPTPNMTQTLKDTQQKESVLENKVKTLQTELQEKTTAESRVLDLQSQLTDLIKEREKMTRELELLRRQSVPAPSVAPTSTTTTTQTPKMPTIQIIQPGRAVKVGLPRLTTFPNIVTGIVKDKDKNLLPGVLVTVKDKEGVPVRALKTNRLGQFAASTQLPNGVYLVEIEDPRFRYTFDRAQVTLNGTIVPALEIFAKTEKEITRAKLERELFGIPNT
jgi:hypothetical protein